MFYSKLHRHAAVSAALLLAASCSDGPITAPASPLGHEGAVASARGGKSSRGDVLKRSSRLSENVTASATITPEGGFLELPGAGLLVYFPPGALSQTTVVSATALRGKRVRYDFQPHGITFATPIYVAQSLAHTELNTPKARKKRPYIWGGYLANGEKDILASGIATFSETFDAYFSGTETEMLAVFTTNHFSQYAFASGARPASHSSE